MKDTHSRRDIVRVLGASLVGAPLLGCAGEQMMLGDSGVATDSGLDDAGIAPDAGGDDGSTDGSAAAGWASGGTAAMTDAPSYPDPFDAAVSCALIGTATLGPCYTSAPLRRDVSEGYPGLPVRLALKVLDADCQVIRGARVEIWHTRNSGLYSEGPTSMCTSGDVDADAHTYFRGAQLTDADGQVAFDTCFPGWYRGRAIHIHFQVFLADGTAATKISQLFFPPDLVAEIFGSHVDYAEFGPPDTSNASDSIYASVGDAGVVEYERMSDGAMLAWKQIRVI